MRHDFKFYEIRRPTSPAIYAWCVCGGWFVKQDHNLDIRPLLDGFYSHLEARWTGNRVPAPTKDSGQ